MPAPATTDDFLGLVRRSELVAGDDLDAFLRDNADQLPESPTDLAATLVRDGLLTGFQSGLLLKGKSKGFLIAGKYKLLEHLGSGGMANVFLCEHMSMRRRVALKVLPSSQAADPSALERFYREARAVASLDHPNIVRAHDIDHDGKQHFLVMEYVEGISLNDLVRRNGPLDILRASHYVRQAALGLHHAHEAGVVHRDIKPGNILLDRQGTVKILDMGLARFFTDETDDTTHRYDENCVLGTADYCAPEQAMNSHGADIRADIYSLGATFYFVLTGQTPFGPGTTAQKIIWHQMREPAPLREVRPEVPEGLAEVVARMMAKDLAERYQTPAEVYDALAPWTEEPIGPPPEEEMPSLSLRSQAPGSSVRNTIRPQTAPLSTRPNSAPRSSSSTTKILPRLVKGKKKSPRLPILMGAGAAVLIVVGVVVIWLMRTGGDTTPTGRAAVVPRDADAGKAVAAPLPEGVTIIRAGNKGRRVQTPKYEAVVGDDGSLTSLRAGGVELLKSGVPFGPDREARGIYLYSDRDGMLPATEIDQAGNVVTARGRRAEVRYAFHPDSVLMTAINQSDDPDLKLLWYGVFERSVTAVTNGQGDWSASPPPAESSLDWPSATWFAGSTRLAFSRATRIWGPWPSGANPFHVWQLSLKPLATESVTVTIGEATPEEQRRAARASGATPPTADVPPQPPEPPSFAIAPAGVTVAADGAERLVRAATYEAKVEADGNLTSLRVDGAELLYVGGQTSRGCYFYRPTDAARPAKGPAPATQKLPTVEQPAPNVLTAKNEYVSVRYEFGANAFAYDLTNNCDVSMVYFVVFNRKVTAVRDVEGKVSNLPTRRLLTAGAWLAGKSGLAFEGGNDIWGPWEEGAEVLQVNVPPKTTQRLQFRPLTAAGAGAAAVKPAVALLAPRDWQVFQRSSRRRGEVRFRGQAPAGTERVEARLTGPSLDGALPDAWQALPLAADGRGFDAALPVAAGGWYRVEVRALRGTDVLGQTALDHVGVGEVFVGAGQSNSTNSGEERLKPESGLVASFDGSRWQPATDPQPGTHDSSGGGSFWPAFGDALNEKYKVPIGVAVTGHGGTSVKEWEPKGELSAYLTKRMAELGPKGFRAVLWHQGENDTGMAADNYERLLTEVIQESRKAAGWDVPWFVAQVSYVNPGAPKKPELRAAQKALWDKKVAFEGPDTDALGGDNRDQGGAGIHFSGKGLRAHGRLWADKVAAYLDKALGE